MISLILLLKIIGGICFIVSWVFMFLRIRRTQRYLECLREHCDGRLDAMVQSIEQGREADEPENGDLAEARRRAIEAERRFTEGMASILNFSCTSARELIAGDLNTGKKGE